MTGQGALRWSIAIALIVLLFVGGAAAAATSIAISASGSNGESTIEAPSSDQPCVPEDEIGFLANHDLNPGQFASLPGSLTFSLGIGVFPADDSAFLLPDESFVTLSNSRGSVRLQLTPGSCDSPSLTFVDQMVSGTVTWTVDSIGTTGAYNEAVGSGTMQFDAQLSPGTANVWDLDIDGSITVRPPSLSATLLSSTWSHAGAEPGPGRVATVTYRLTNTGPGDAFGGVVLDAHAAEGIDPIDFEPISVGDIPAGDSAEFAIQWRIGNTSNGPAVKGREFDTTLTIDVADALDVDMTADHVVHVVVPRSAP